MRSSPAPLPALLPDYEREKLKAEMLLHKAAYGACLPMVEVYDRFVARGWLEARRGVGFYVDAPGQRPSEAPPPHMSEAIDILSLLREQLCQVHPFRVGDGRLPRSWMEDSELGPQSRARPDHPLIAAARRHCAGRQPRYYPLSGKLKLARIEMACVRRLPDAAQIARHRPKVFFTQSLADNPIGGSIALPIAHRQLQIAAQHDLVIVEDDPFADMMPSSAPQRDQLKRVTISAPS